MICITHATAATQVQTHLLLTSPTVNTRCFWTCVAAVAIVWLQGMFPVETINSMRRKAKSSVVNHLLADLPHWLGSQIVCCAVTLVLIRPHTGNDSSGSMVSWVGGVQHWASGLRASRGRITTRDRGETKRQVWWLKLSPSRGLQKTELEPEEMGCDGCWSS